MTIRNNHNLIFQSFCLVYGLYFECILVFLNGNAFLAHCSFPIVEKEPEVVTLLAAIGHQLVAKCHYKGILCIYIEVFDRYDKPTLTGRLVYPIADKFIVQWEEEKKVYPKAICLGSIF